MHNPETAWLIRLHSIGIILLAIGSLATNLVRSQAERRLADRVITLEQRVATLEASVDRAR